jgi:hypothetical protein
MKMRSIPKKYLEISFLILVVLLSGYLRLINLEQNPGWYSDEGTQIEIAQNLLQGKIQYFSLNQSTLIIARLPLFSLILTLIFKLFGVGILQLRVFSVGLGIFTILTVFVVLKSILKRDAGVFPILTALIFSVYPSAIMYHRLGFSYNLLSLLILLSFWGLWKFSNDDGELWFYLLSISLGLACIVDIEAFVFFPFAILIVLIFDYRKFPLFGLITFFPFIVYSLVMLIISPEAFIFDFRFSFSRVDNVPLFAQFIILLNNILNLIMKDNWIAFGLLGFFVMPNRKFGVFLFFFVLFPILLLGRVASITGISFYYFIPFFSFIVIGISGFTIFFFRTITISLENVIIQFLEKTKFIGRHINVKVKLQLSRIVSAFILSIFISPLTIFIIFQDYSQSVNYWNTDLEPIMVNPYDAKKAMEFINHNVTNEDLVIASPALAWIVMAKKIDFQISLAYLRKSTMHLPGDIPYDRFTFNSDYKEAKYVIIDNIWTNWAIINNSYLQSMVKDIKKWPLVWNSGQIYIYQNLDLLQN